MSVPLAETLFGFAFLAVFVWFVLSRYYPRGVWTGNLGYFMIWRAGPGQQPPFYKKEALAGEAAKLAWLGVMKGDEIKGLPFYSPLYFAHGWKQGRIILGDRSVIFLTGREDSMLRIPLSKIRSASFKAEGPFEGLGIGALPDVYTIEYESGGARKNAVFCAVSTRSGIGPLTAADLETIKGHFAPFMKKG